ncbi:MAG TPA: UvrD-helicase domain-containing protein [Planctomycetota bacterium]|nr:UvrD-helicase domain-containing protein [Planctomycetota bacterium]
MDRAALPAESALVADLNPEQRRAVAHGEGPLLVLAGAGTGKTRVVTRRIACLLARGVSARNVLAVTFTNKAAREMRERVADLVGAATARELTVSTFHSFCARFLREHAAAAGLRPGFTICDEADQLSAIKNALREVRIPETSLHPNAALAAVSRYKNRLVSPEEALDCATEDGEELAARAYRAYEEHLRRSGAVDFDDLLLRTVRLLDRDEGVLRRAQDRYLHLLVDEYQDTNAPQYEILRRLAGRHRNIAVVGDDDQSIYAFRGADVRKILNFPRDFPGAQIVRLEANYRSTQSILDAAASVIRHNRARHEKSLRAQAGRGDPVRVFELEDEEHEAQFVVEEIAHRVRQGKARLGDFAILFRTQTQPRPFEAALRAARIPYELVGGMSFFDRKEVRDVLAYLRLAVNPDDEPSLLRVLNVPPRGVGKATVDRALEAAAREGISVGQVLDRARPGDGLGAAAVEAVRRFRRTLAEFAAWEKAEGLPAAIRKLLAALDYPKELERCYPDAVARQARWAAVEEIANLAENYARRAGGRGVEGFLEELTLAAEEPEEDEEEPRERVTLMTLHAAKGLEFPRVYLVGAEEGLLPHHRSAAEDGIEEERRLMYVGITRARVELTITRAKTRARYGRREACFPSRFLFEMRGLPAPAPAAAAAPRGLRRGG